jgi:hypothetical protein
MSQVVGTGQRAVETGGGVGFWTDGAADGQL